MVEPAATTRLGGSSPPEVVADAFSRRQRRIHLVCYALLCLLLAATLATRVQLPIFVGDLIPTDVERVALLDQRIDPNTATWSELASLPQIGEITAKSIIAYREQARSRQDLTTSAPIFTCAEDLEAVRGIGKKTVAQLAPHLRFNTSASMGSQRRH